MLLLAYTVIHDILIHVRYAKDKIRLKSVHESNGQSANDHQFLPA